jgi:hypothetical protein
MLATKPTKQKRKGRTAFGILEMMVTSFRFILCGLKITNGAENGEWGHSVHLPSKLSYLPLAEAELQGLLSSAKGLA